MAPVLGRAPPREAVAKRTARQRRQTVPSTTNKRVYGPGEDGAASAARGRSRVLLSGLFVGRWDAGVAARACVRVVCVCLFEVSLVVVVDRAATYTGLQVGTRRRARTCTSGVQYLGDAAAKAALWCWRGRRCRTKKSDATGDDVQQRKKRIAWVGGERDQEGKGKTVGGTRETQDRTRGPPARRGHRTRARPAKRYLGRRRRCVNRPVPGTSPPGTLPGWRHSASAGNMLLRLPATTDAFFSLGSRQSI